MSFGVLFPGQGSQFVGMGTDLFDARPDLLGERSDQILGWSLREMCLEGPEEALTRTEYAQPALFALSYALWDILAEVLPSPPAGAVGHSLGEYTALTASGALGYEAALGVVARRGKAMANAADLEPSGMAALIGADEDLATSIATRRQHDGGRLQVANINAPGQVVLAGGADDIDWLAANSRDLGVRRAIPLKVAGAFHSAFMEPAADEVAGALAGLEFDRLAFPVWSNTTAAEHEPDMISGLLIRQMVSPVRFRECLLGMAASGIDTFVHVGPGDVTAGMARRSVENATVVVVSTIDDIPAAVEVIGTMA
ncbi:MAG: ACP S-malonyltransferase [Actinobacteria bacterium]|nr:ACP S-malonyltransferase [Actinomycetota bacterium]